VTITLLGYLPAKVPLLFLTFTACQRCVYQLEYLRVLSFLLHTDKQDESAHNKGVLHGCLSKPQGRQDVSKSLSVTPKKCVLYIK